MDQKQLNVLASSPLCCAVHTHIVTFFTSHKLIRVQNFSLVLNFLAIRWAHWLTPIYRKQCESIAHSLLVFLAFADLCSWCTNYLSILFGIRIFNVKFDNLIELKISLTGSPLRARRRRLSFVFFVIVPTISCPRLARGWKRNALLYVNVREMIHLSFQFFFCFLRPHVIFWRWNSERFSVECWGVSWIGSRFFIVRQCETTNANDLSHHRIERKSPIDWSLQTFAKSQIAIAVDSIDAKIMHNQHARMPHRILKNHTILYELIYLFVLLWLYTDLRRLLFTCSHTHTNI